MPVTVEIRRRRRRQDNNGHGSITPLGNSIGRKIFRRSEELGNVKQLHGIKVGAPPKFEPIADTEFVMEADLVLLAMGFTGPVRNGMIEQLGVKLDVHGNVEANGDYMSSVPGVFAAGDMRRGQSLVVWAIAEGRKAAASIDKYLSQPVPKTVAKTRAKRDLVSA